MKYELIINPKYKLDSEIKMQIKIDSSKFAIETNSSSINNGGDDVYTITIPSSTENKYHTGIFVTPNNSDYTKEETMKYSELEITNFISSDSNKYDYTAKFAFNPFTITYTIDSNVVGTQDYTYGDTITPLSAETKDGYTFSWENMPSTMPYNDLTIIGEYTKIIDSNDLYYGSIYNNVLSSLTDDEFVEKLTRIENIEKNVDYSFTLYSETSEVNADNLSDEEYDGWESTHYYSQCIAIPNGFTINSITENNVDYSTHFTFYKSLTINNWEYELYTYTNDNSLVPSDMSKDSFSTIINFK